MQIFHVLSPKENRKKVNGENFIKFNVFLYKNFLIRSLK